MDEDTEGQATHRPSHSLMQGDGHTAHLLGGRGGACNIARTKQALNDKAGDNRGATITMMLPLGGNAGWRQVYTSRGRVHWPSHR